jgi:hypothetical protein
MATGTLPEEGELRLGAVMLPPGRWGSRPGRWGSGPGGGEAGPGGQETSSE